MGKELNKTGLDQGDYTNSDLGYEDNTAKVGKPQYKHKGQVGADVHPSNFHSKSKGGQGREGSPQSDSVNAGDHLWNEDGRVNGDPEQCG